MITTFVISGVVGPLLWLAATYCVGQYPKTEKVLVAAAVVATSLTVVTLLVLAVTAINS